MRYWIGRALLTIGWIGFYYFSTLVPEGSPDYIIFRVSGAVFVAGSILASVIDGGQKP